MFSTKPQKTTRQKNLDAEEGGQISLKIGKKQLSVIFSPQSSKWGESPFCRSFIIVLAGGLEMAFCSYQLKMNLKNICHCLFDPMIGQ